jgi:hypothetical protein
VIDGFWVKGNSMGFTVFLLCFSEENGLREG